MNDLQIKKEQSIQVAQVHVSKEAFYKTKILGMIQVAGWSITIFKCLKYEKFKTRIPRDFTVSI